MVILNNFLYVNQVLWKKRRPVSFFTSYLRRVLKLTIMSLLNNVYDVLVGEMLIIFVRIGYAYT